MRTPTTCILPFFLFLCTGACTDNDDPSEPGATNPYPSGATLDDSTGDPTDGSASGDESSDEGAPPIVCNPEDDIEPNNGENEAEKLPNITDDDADGSRIESILAGEGDVDWFAYMGSDVAFAYVDPASGIDADMELRLCLFVECTNGNTKPFTCTDSIYDESPDNTFPGCCNTGGSAFVSIDLYCDAGDDDSAYVFMRVDQGHADVCVPYEITYHF